MYLCPNRVELAGQMPSFDEWVLRPIGLVGPHENPVVAAPLLAASIELAPRVGAGRQASLEAGGAGVDVPTPLGVPEPSSSGTREARPEAVVEGEMQPAAPEAGAPEALASQHKVEPDCSSRLGAPKVDCLGASPAAPHAGPHVQRLGRFHVDYAALRKRKESLSCSGGTIRPLKDRKYISIDE